jgi:hypothetical protein
MMVRNRTVQLVGLGLVVALVTIGTLAVVLFPRQSVSAESSRVTRGDAQAILNTRFSGCGAIIAHGNVHEGQPCEDIPRARIALTVSGNHYCADDWHVIVVYDTEFVDVTNPLLQTRAAVIDDLQATTASWALDGSPLPTTTLPVRPIDPTYSQQQFGAPSWYFTNGTVLAPEALSVGPHSKTLMILDPALGAITITNTFEIDASGTGACL